MLFRRSSARKQFYGLLFSLVLALVLSACGSTDLPSTQAPVLVDTVTPVTISTPFPTKPITPTALFPSLDEIAVRPVTPFPTLAPICEDAPRNRMIIGEHGRVSSQSRRPLNIRAEAGTEGRILGRLEVNEVFRVLDGVVCRNGFTWYLIERLNGELRGWVAEGESGFYYIEPYLIG